MFNPGFYVDEIYGRRLSVTTDYHVDGVQDINANVITLTLDGQTMLHVPSYTNEPNGQAGTTRGFPAHIQLIANHPYAASADGTPTTNGDYMDEAVDKPVVLITPFSIVHGWGDVSPNLFSKWSGESRNRLLPPPAPAPNCGGDPCVHYGFSQTGSFDREKTNADWLAQYTRAAQIHAAIAHAIPQLHHAIGVVYADTSPLQSTYPWGFTGPISYSLADSFDRVDVDAALSLTSTTANGPDRKGAIQGIAASAAALEGSVGGQLSDLPDTSSSATRFEWANNPPPGLQNPRSLGPRNFYQIDHTIPNAMTGLVQVEGYLVNPTGGGTNCPTNNGGVADWTAQPLISISECQEWGTALTQGTSAYAQANFTVVAAQDAFLGPGQRGGAITPLIIGSPQSYTHQPSKQRGGVFVATQYDTSGDPVQIAHIQAGQSPLVDGTTLLTKGGGGGVQPDNGSSYNPAEAADILKSQFVDRSNLLGVNLSNGSFGYTSPASLRIGNGGFPYELSANMPWHPTAPKFGPVSPTEPQRDWNMSWFNSLGVSGSGMEAMGQSDIRAAAGTIAAFMAAQDIYETETTPVPESEVTAVLANAWWSDQIVGNVASVSVGNDTRQFVRLANGQWILPGTSFGSVTQNNPRVPYEYKCGATGAPPYPYSRGWDINNVTFDVFGAHADAQRFTNWTNQYSLDDQTGSTSCGQLKGFRLTAWTFPYGGMVVYLDYGNKYDPHGSGTPGVERLTDVHNSIGRQIDFKYVAAPEILTSFTNHLSSTDDLRTVTIDPHHAFMLDPLGNKAKFTYSAPTLARPVLYDFLGQIYTANDLSNPNIQYGFDTLGRVNQVWDAAASLPTPTRGPYNFFIADGTRGERDDPLGQPYTVYYDQYGHPSRYVDELGIETDSLFDSRGRVSQYAYPEGDQESFDYDDNNNTTTHTRIRKPVTCTTGCAPIVESAVWNSTLNKPSSITNANGQTTNFYYYPNAGQGCTDAHGYGNSLLCKAVRPAVTGGNPTYTFTYNDIGKLLTSTEPLGTGTILTTNNYDASNPRNLTSTVFDSGTSPHLNLTTNFGYDLNGDVTSIGDPRNRYTEQLFDLDRRKYQVNHHDGGLGAAIIAASKTIFDPVGRDIEDDMACGDAACLTIGSPTWKAVKQTRYTPTSQVAQVTDADNKTTIYYHDDADRLYLMQDPAGRKTRYNLCNIGDANCAANQVEAEIRAWSSGLQCAVTGTLQECYRRLTYGADGEKTSIEDANNNITNYTYDLFNRLQTTTFPDSSTETLTYDPASNIKSRTNRAGSQITFDYDALDRMIDKIVPAYGGYAAYTVNWAYDLGGRITELSDTRSNDLQKYYDPAGRLNSTVTTIPGMTGTLSTGYGFDPSGNLYQLLFPGGYYVDFCNDSLNRRTAVIENSGDPNCATGLLATYSYDTLSRRSDLTYTSTSTGQRDGMGYSYSLAGDLLSLRNDLNGTGNDNTWTLGYSDAHQLNSEAASNSAWPWQPPANTSATYAAANNLNQYPTVSAGSVVPIPYSFGYDADGNLTSGNIALSGSNGWSFGYDPENRLLNADKTTGGAVHAVYAYDPSGRRTHKSGTGTTETFFLDDESGNEIAEYDSTGALTRRFIPGPSINDPVAMVTGTSSYTHTYYHTDHHGSVAMMARDNGNPLNGPFLYDPHGNCSTASTACNALAPAVQPFFFAGMYLDRETGLYYDRARYYSSALGRFLQTDPVGYDVDLNLYTYGGNDPVNEEDPTGTECGTRIGAAPSSICGDTKDPDPSHGNPDAGSPNNQITHPNAQQFGFQPPVSTNTGAQFAGVEGGPGALVVPEVIYEVLKPTPANPTDEDRVMADRNYNFHHSWPKYLGGAQDQQLVRLPQAVHNAYHAGLDRILPRQRGAGFYRDLSPTARIQLNRSLAAYTKAFDTKYGTNLFDAMRAEGFPEQ